MKKLFVIITLLTLTTGAGAQTHMRIHSTKGTTDVAISEFDSITFITKGAEDPFNGHAYVDLALPSGLLWATVNVGASQPIEYGHYFAWGETAPKENYTWDTYKFGTQKALTKYNTYGAYGKVDGITTLEPQDDAATQQWGGNWRMPTNAEMEELFSADNVTWTWKEVEGTYGYYGVSTRNDATIFLPAAGSIDNNTVNWSSELKGNSAYGRYWTSSLYTINNVTYDAFYWWFNLNKPSPTGTYRSYGRTVRAVVAPTK